jgi:HAMP domain-containing protein
MRIVPALGVALAAALAAGCGASQPSRKTTTSAAGRACVLSARQHAAIARTERDILKLHRLQGSVHAYSYAGTPPMQRQTDVVLRDIGRVKLPINTRARLLREAKGASGLCGSCFGAFEAAEPAVVSRFGGAECGS